MNSHIICVRGMIGLDSYLDSQIPIIVALSVNRKLEVEKRQIVSRFVALSGDVD